MFILFWFYQHEITYHYKNTLAGWIKQRQRRHWRLHLKQWLIALLESFGRNHIQSLKAIIHPICPQVPTVCEFQIRLDEFMNKYLYPIAVQSLYIVIKKSCFIKNGILMFKIDTIPITEICPVVFEFLNGVTMVTNSPIVTSYVFLGLKLI